MNTRRMIHKLGGTRLGVWLIKHLIAPLDRSLYRITRGRLVSTGRQVAPTLLLTTTGRKTGLDRTHPVFYLEDENRSVICNVNPGFERPNPWTLNIRAHPRVAIQINQRVIQCTSREAEPWEAENYWLELVQIWPAYQTHFDRSGDRSIFVLSPLEDAPPVNDKELS